MATPSRISAAFRYAAAGYGDAEQLQTDKDLDPLRQRDDFKKLLGELGAKAKPAK